MGHQINALIGTQDALIRLIEQLGSPAPTALPFGLVIVPLDECRLDAIAMSTEDAIDGFTYLTPRMAAAIAAMAQGPALYIETEYFGGMGAQSAAYFQDGELAWRSAKCTEAAPSGSSLARLHEEAAASGISPINRGLMQLGVSRSDELDEFDQIGLGRFRSLEELGFE
jgi:hypothetical protein